MRLARSRGNAALLMLLAAFSGAAQVYGPALTQGAAFTSAVAEQAEAGLKTNPRDLITRARLLGYYSARAAQDPAMRGGRLTQIEWLIENDPATLLLRHPTVILQPTDFAAPYRERLEELRRAWQQQVDRHPDDAIAIENAVRSLGRVEVNTSDAGRLLAYLKRLRVLEPGDPEWALELASELAYGLPRGLAPNASADAKQFAAMSKNELEQSTDASVVGLAGGFLYESARMQPNQPAIAPFLQFCESLVRKAAALNPKNPAWLRLLDGAPPKNGAEMASAIMDTLAESDLWPGGAAPAMSIPPGAIGLPDGIAMRGTVLQFEPMPPNAGTACNVRFDIRIGTDGRIKTLQVAAFDHLYVPFEAAARDAVRRAQFQPVSANGQLVEAVTHIDLKCPNGPPKTIAIVGEAEGVPGGVPGGVLGGTAPAAPPPPPSRPPPPSKSAQEATQVGSRVMAARIVQRVEPVYPAIARQARIQGVVRLDLIIGTDGKVESMKVLDGPPLLRQAAISAVQQWAWEPLLVNGEPVKVHTETDVIFTLSK